MLRLATMDDLKWIADRADAHSQELGWLPRIAYERAIEEQRVLVNAPNDQTMTFAHYGAASGHCRIYQIWTEEDSRRATLATEVLDQVNQVSWQNKIETISCHCARELPANAFWESLGWIRQAERPTGKHHARVAYQWMHTTTYGHRVAEEIQRRQPAPEQRKLHESFGTWTRVLARLHQQIRREL